jgi:hypothetical protein
VIGHFQINLLRDLYQEQKHVIWRHDHLIQGVDFIASAYRNIFLQAGVTDVDVNLIKEDLKENIRCTLKPRRRQSSNGSSTVATSGQ